eukprot:scaffold100_cov323-Pavlova_lutheri.AAC.8
MQGGTGRGDDEEAGASQEKRGRRRATRRRERSQERPARTRRDGQVRCVDRAKTERREAKRTTPRWDQAGMKRTKRNKDADASSHVQTKPNKNEKPKMNTWTCSWKKAQLKPSCRSSPCQSPNQSWKIPNPQAGPSKETWKKKRASSWGCWPPKQNIKGSSPIAACSWGWCTCCKSTNHVPPYRS